MNLSLVTAIWAALAGDGGAAAAGGAGSAGAGAVDSGAADVTGAGAAATAEGSAPAPTVAARADRSEAQVGDPIRLTVTAVGPRTVPVNLPAAMDIDPFSVLGRREEEKDLGGGRVRRDFVLDVAAYEPGETAIPPIEVTYLGPGGEVLAVRTAAVPIRIRSLIANEPEPALKESAPPVAVLEDNPVPIYVAAGLGAAALGALVALVVRRRLRARALRRPAPPPRPAHELALDRLDRLGAGLGQGDDARAFHFAVSEVIRDYLGARFEFDSLELTTEELMRALARRAERELLLVEIESWLSACDLVKFAKRPATEAEARGVLETAIRIVESTRPRPAPAAGTGTLAVAAEGAGHD